MGFVSREALVNGNSFLFVAPTTHIMQHGVFVDVRLACAKISSCTSSAI